VNRKDIQLILRAWGRVLTGGFPSLSVEITRECPLRCPGCYAFEENHLAGKNLRSLTDFKGDELIERTIALIDEEDPFHLSIVGGDPLVRYRELDVLLPIFSERNIRVLLVTSAFRPIPQAWASLPHLRIAVSVDGLQPEHDVRRKPATYEKILQNIEGQHVAIHCNVTSAMLRRPGYLREFVEYWSANPNAEKIWMSIFTPQRGAKPVECVSMEERKAIVLTLLELRKMYPKLAMAEEMLKEYLAPPKSPSRCIFARTTRSVSADFKTRVVPCQLGGDPDCSQCGCAAAMGMAAIGNHKLVGPLAVGHLFFASAFLGDTLQHISKVGRSSRETFADFCRE